MTLTALQPKLQEQVCRSENEINNIMSLISGIIPDAIRTECAKCNPSQKKHVGKVLSYLFHNRKNYWDDLLAKFDPDKSLREKYGFT
ncbi:ejaculatory bulb-specific protein 3-like [Diaphorina citri]|uniref:Ejaculatory bulb-specific protein 3-like n=1 Tax=Diaphorina citri TaxID=121845 RepID=A0A3Q0J553_DIACI|nr:ejaculatory bulb-specific protein 3-like [Diaphorina citri]